MGCQNLCGRVTHGWFRWVTLTLWQKRCETLQAARGKTFDGLAKKNAFDAVSEDHRVDVSANRLAVLMSKSD